MLSFFWSLSLSHLGWFLLLCAQTHLSFLRVWSAILPEHFISGTGFPLWKFDKT